MGTFVTVNCASRSTEPALAATLGRAWGWGGRSVLMGRSIEGDGWVRCAEVTRQYLAGWEVGFTARVVADTRRPVPRITSTAYVLKHYAALPGLLGAICFHLDRRVPRLAREAIAFHPDEGYRYPRRLALLDERFWCLPTDPQADHPAATVLADEEALAARLRTEVRGHADDFLAGYVPMTRLARRHRLGVFFDGLDQWLWLAGRYSGHEHAGVADAHLVLPGGTAEFDEPSTVYAFVDGQGRPRASRVRTACCYYHRLPGGDACLTCPRITSEERLRRALEEEQAAPASSW